MRLFLVVLCASCLFCGKGKSDEKKDVSGDTTEISKTVEDSKDVVKAADSIVTDKMKMIKK